MTDATILDKQFFGNAFRIYDTRPRWPFDDEEPPMLKYWPRIRPGDVVVDVGAAVGVYALTALAMGATCVFAVEPSQLLGGILQKNLELNEWSNRANVCRYALSDGTVPEALTREMFTEHCPADDLMWIRLDDLCDELDDDDIQVSYVKIDVEGMEYHVLNGGLETLRQHRPTLVIENHEPMDGDSVVCTYPKSIDSTRKIHAMLTELGYTIDVMPWSCGREYICAVHPSRGTL